jgi:hypothetical protein
MTAVRRGFRCAPSNGQAALGVIVVSGIFALRVAGSRVFNHALRRMPRARRRIVGTERKDRIWRSEGRGSRFAPGAAKALGGGVG